MATINDNIVSRFLVDPKLNICRHLSLITFILFITLGFIWYVPNELASPTQKVLGWIIYSIVFLGMVYLNIYVIIPHFLLKDKIGAYFFILFDFNLISVATILFVQKILWGVSYPHFSYTYIVINALSGMLTFGLLFAGTSTVILFRRWIKSDQQAHELESSILESELKLLKNQINPHFLFNMLNNANMLLKKDKEEASRVLFKLEDMLRYQLNDSVKEEVLLTDDIHFLNDFLNLEKIRRDSFEYSILQEGNIEQVKVPPLLFITFVENAIKHNPDNEKLSYVHLSFKIENNKLDFICKNSKPAVAGLNRRAGGLGLKNIKRRLEIIFPDRYLLSIKDETTAYTVKLTLAL